MKPTEKQNEQIKHVINSLMHKNVTLNSPTGSGKSYLLYRMCGELIRKGFRPIIVTSSQGGLDSDLAISLREYMEKDGEFTFRVKYIKSRPPSRRYGSLWTRDKYSIDDNEVFVIGNAQLRKGISSAESLKDLISLSSNNKFILMKDESHLGNTFLKEFEALFYRVLYLSATQDEIPIFENIKTSVKDVNSGGLKLIKTNEIRKSFKNQRSALRAAIETYKKIEYENIVPCMLIQLRNGKPYYWVKNELEKHSLRYVDVTSGKFTSKQMNVLKEEFSKIQIILFKVNVSTGWNIPRAKILLQLRKVKSEKLQIQTEGRVKRLLNRGEPKENDYYIFQVK